MTIPVGPLTTYRRTRVAAGVVATGAWRSPPCWATTVGR